MTVRVAAPLADLLDGDRGPGVAAPADGLGAGQSVLGDVDDQVHRPAGRGAFESEGQLPAGQVTQRDGAAYVEGLGRPEVSLLLGAHPECVLEVEGVGEVDLGVDLDGAVEGDLVELDIDVPLLRSLPALGFGGFGVEPDHRRLDRAVELRPRTRVSDRREVLVDMGGTGHRQGPWSGRRSARPATTAASRPCTRSQSRGRR